MCVIQLAGGGGGGGGGVYYIDISDAKGTISLTPPPPPLPPKKTLLFHVLSGSDIFILNFFSIDNGFSVCFYMSAIDDRKWKLYYQGTVFIVHFT